MHPERVRAVAGLSAPAVPRAPEPPLGLMRKFLGEDFYFVWFQEPGVADAALAADVRRTLTTREVWDAAWAQRHDEPPTPRFMTEEDLAVYVRGLRAHRVHGRPELVPQHRPQLGDARGATPAARSTSRRCSSPAAATR